VFLAEGAWTKYLSISGCEKIRKEQKRYSHDDSDQLAKRGRVGGEGACGRQKVVKFKKAGPRTSCLEYKTRERRKNRGREEEGGNNAGEEVEGSLISKSWKVRSVKKGTLDSNSGLVLSAEQYRTSEKKLGTSPITATCGPDKPIRKHEFLTRKTICGPKKNSRKETEL